MRVDGAATYSRDHLLWLCRRESGSCGWHGVRENAGVRVAVNPEHAHGGAAGLHQTGRAIAASFALLY
jgi:hypothetical protein